MKRITLLIIAILPLLLNGCGGKDNHMDLPAPPDNGNEQPIDDGGGNGNGNGSRKNRDNGNRKSGNGDSAEG